MDDGQNERHVFPKIYNMILIDEKMNIQIFTIPILKTKQNYNEKKQFLI